MTGAWHGLIVLKVSKIVRIRANKIIVGQNTLKGPLHKSMS